MSQTTCHLLLGPYQDGASQASHRHGIADGAFAELYTLWSTACVLLAPFPARRSTRSPHLTGVAPAVGGFHFWNKLPGTRLGEVARVLPARIVKKLFTPSRSGARTAPPGLGYTYLIRAGRSNAIPSAWMPTFCGSGERGRQTGVVLPGQRGGPRR